MIETNMTRRGFLRAMGLSGIAAGSLMTQNATASIIDGIFPKIVPNNPAQIFTPDEAISYFVNADSAQLLHLYNNFFGHIVEVGPAVFDEMKLAVSNTEEVVAKIGQNRRRQSGPAPDEKLLQLNHHRVSALVPTMAAHMQYLASDEDETKAIHAEIEKGLLSENPQITEITFQNLITSTRPSQFNKGQIAQGNLFFAQTDGSNAILENIVDAIGGKSDTLIYRYHLITYLKNLCNLAQIAGDFRTATRCEQLLDKLAAEPNSISAYFRAVLDKSTGPSSRIVAAPQITELVSAHSVGRAKYKIPFALIEAYVLIYANYFQNVSKLTSSDEQAGMLRKMHSFMNDFDVYTVLEQSVRFKTDGFDQASDDLKNFIESDILAMKGIDSTQFASEEGMVAKMRQDMASEVSGSNFMSELPQETRKKILDLIHRDDAESLVNGVSILLTGMTMLSNDPILERVVEQISDRNSQKEYSSFLEKHKRNG